MSFAWHQDSFLKKIQEVINTTKSENDPDLESTGLSKVEVEDATEPSPDLDPKDPEKQDDLPDLTDTTRSTELVSQDLYILLEKTFTIL